MIFDDTFEHEAWNRTDGVRVILFVDIMRPMRFPANMLNAVFTWVIAPPFVLGSRPVTIFAGKSVSRTSSIRAPRRVAVESGPASVAVYG